MRIEFEVPEDILHQLLDPVLIPPMARVRARIPTPPAIEDVAGAVRDQMRDIDAGRFFQPGQRVAIAVGSRGIGRLRELVAALVATLRELGVQPFIVPAMGSHGGATAEGQREVLAHLGITPENVAAPVESSMAVVEVGRTAAGMPVYMDRLAAEADGIVVVARVKPHTAFRGPYESGLAKMIAIGLGKQTGAAATHAQGFGAMAEMVPEMARVALERTPIRFGLAILENAYDLPFSILAVPADRILPDEPALLEEAKRAMPRIPFDRIDVLIIDRIGKNISGDGADPNVTGRYPTPYASGGPEVNKQVVLGLTEATAGNANGVGAADFTTVRLAQAMSLAATYPNALTSTVTRPVAIPMVLPSDRLAFAAALLTCNAVGREPRVVRIQDTLHLAEFAVSAVMLNEVERTPHLQVVSGPQPVDFDAAGNLRDLAPGAAVTPVTAAVGSDVW